MLGKSARARAAVRRSQGIWGADSQIRRFVLDARRRLPKLAGAVLVLAAFAGVWLLWGVVADAGGVLPWALFVADAAGDAALERTTTAGWLLSLVGFDRLHASDDGSAVVSGVHVGAAATRPLPRDLLSRATSGWLPRPGSSERGLGWWASDDLGAVAGARAVCIASVEVACVGAQSGGLGRAMWLQAVALAAEAAAPAGHNVTVIHVPAVPDGAAWSAGRSHGAAPRVPAPRLQSSGCEADLVRGGVWPEHVRLVRLDAAGSAAWRRGPPALLEASALLDLARNAPGACSVLHAHDYRGTAALVQQARRAGERAAGGWPVNVQLHGTDASLALGHSLTDPSRSAADVVMASLERSTLALADSTMLLTEGQAADVTLLTGSPPRRPWVAPNFAQGSVCEALAARPDAGFDTLVFYGRLKFLKGLHLFAQALHEVGPLGPLGVTRVVLVGHKAMDGGELARIRASLLPLVDTLEMKSHLDAGSAGRALRSLATGSLVVLPSLHENQPFGLADVVRSGACFLAADVWGHREALGAPGPSDDVSAQLFAPSPAGLARSLRAALLPGFRCAAACHRLVQSGRGRFLAWHGRWLRGGAGEEGWPGAAPGGDGGGDLDAAALVAEAASRPVAGGSTSVLVVVGASSPAEAGGVHAALASARRQRAGPSVSLAGLLVVVGDGGGGCAALRLALPADAMHRVSCAEAASPGLWSDALLALSAALGEWPGSAGRYCSPLLRGGGAVPRFDLAVVLSAGLGQVLRDPSALADLAAAHRASPAAAVVAAWGGTYREAHERSVADAARDAVEGVQAPGAGPGLEGALLGAAGAGAAPLLAVNPHATAAWDALAGGGPAEGKCATPAEPDAWDGCGVRGVLAGLAWLDAAGASGYAADGASLVVLPKQLAWQAERPAPGAVGWQDQPLQQLRARCALRAARSVAVATRISGIVSLAHYAASLYERAEGGSVAFG